MTLRRIYSEKRVDKSGRVVVIETDSKTVLREHGVKSGRQEDDGGGVEAEGSTAPRTRMAGTSLARKSGGPSGRKRKKAPRKLK